MKTDVLHRIRLNLAWEIILAVPSYLLFVGLRFLLYQTARFRAEKVPKWHFLEAETIKKTLPFIMLIGPRWNTHTFSCNVMMIRVGHELTVRCPDAKMVPLWSAVVRDVHRTAHHHVGTVQLSAGQKTFALKLPPGVYSFMCSYYDFRPGAMTPELWVDGNPVVHRTALPFEASTEIYETVRNRTGLFYRALAGHLYPLLCLRRWVSEGFVHRSFLPVGNPDTTFKFDVVERGDRLHIEVASDLLTTHLVMFTSYNRASFPVHWFRLEENSVDTEPMPCRGFWLLRVQPKESDVPKPTSDQILVMSRPG